MVNFRRNNVGEPETGLFQSQETEPPTICHPAPDPLLYVKPLKGDIFGTFYNIFQFFISIIFGEKYRNGLNIEKMCVCTYCAYLHFVF